MRVLVYNVRGFRVGPSRVADAVRDLRPDVAFITECGTTWQLRKFSRALSMDARHGSLLPIARRARNAILVRPPLSVVRAEAHLFANSVRFHPRGAFSAEVAADPKRFTAIAVHLGLSKGERTRHAAELVSIATTSVHPVLIGGDLNEHPTGPAAVAIATFGRDAWTGKDGGGTFPAEDPVARIDYLFTSKDVEIRGAFVPREAAIAEVSDHLPLVVDLAL